MNITRRKIYIASSWKNAEYIRGLGNLLRGDGHKVFVFCDEENRPEGLSTFVFDAREFSRIERIDFDWQSFPDLEPAKKAFRSDLAGLNWTDTVILFLPSGRSSHLEAGYAVGRRKQLFIFGDLEEHEYDAMYGFAFARFKGNQLDELRDELLGV